MKQINKSVQVLSTATALAQATCASLDQVVEDCESRLNESQQQELLDLTKQHLKS